MLRYLGQLSVDGRLVPDSQKIEAIRRINPPTNLREVRSLLGFLGFYNTHIPNYSKILIPDLLRNHKNLRRYNSIAEIEWTEKHQAAVGQGVSLLESQS